MDEVSSGSWYGSCSRKLLLDGFEGPAFEGLEDLDAGFGGDTGALCLPGRTIEGPERSSRKLVSSSNALEVRLPFEGEAPPFLICSQN